MSEPSGINNSNHRYRQLDSLRGLAAFFVFLSHYILVFKFSSNWVSYLSESPLGVLINGRAAVMFFFVLSGFVLSLPFVENNRPLKFTEFYIKRIFRIYPAYLFAILFAVILKTFVYRQSDMQSFSPWVGHFWTWQWNAKTIKEVIKTCLIIGPHFNADLIVR